MNQRVIILRGAPASGKTTLAKHLFDFNNKIIWLKVDNFKDFFGPYSDEALYFVNGSALATMKYLIEQGFSPILDGVFQDTQAIDDAVIYAKEKNIPIRIFELKTSLETLKQRDLKREGVQEGFRKPMDIHSLETVYNNLKDSPYPGSISLDTENQSIDECKDIILTSFT